MRQLWCVLVILLCSALAMAQGGKIYGTVTDSLGDPLIGVNVIAKEGWVPVPKSESFGTITDIDGHYELALPLVSNYLVEFKYLGYESGRKKIKIQSGDELNIDIRLREEARELGIVTVSASKYEKKFGEESVTVEVLTPEFIENTSSITLSEALPKIPGVNMIGENIDIRGGSGYSGGAGSRVLLLLDDIPLLAPQNGLVEFGTLPLENIKQVEVIKGASSALYGSSALNGTINVITKNPSNQPEYKFNMYYGFYEKPLKGEKKKYNWNDKLQNIYGAAFVFRKRIKRFDLVLNSAFNRDESFLYANEQNRLRGNIKTRWRPKNLDRLTVGVNANVGYKYGDFFFLWAGWPYMASNPDTIIDSLLYVPSTVATHQEIPFNVDPYLTYFDKKDNKHYIKSRLYFTNTKASGEGTTKARLFFGEYTFHGSINLNSSFVQLDFVTGTAGTYSDINSDVFGQRKSRTGALFFQMDAKLFKKLTITGGARVELYSLDTLPIKVQPIGRGGINYQLAEASYIRASFGQGYRFPSIAERYALLSRANQLVAPNAGLNPESSWSAEVGFKQGFKISRWYGYVDVSGFITKYHDMIEVTIAPDSIKQKYWPNAGFFPVFWFANVADARIAGFEISALGQGEIFGVKTNFFVGYTYLNPVDLGFPRQDGLYPQFRDSTSSNLLNYRFRHSLKGDIETTFKGVTIGITGYINSFMENVEPGIDGIFISTTTALGTFRRVNQGPNYTLDARIGYNFTDAAKVLFVVKNITNNQYLNKPAHLEPPRNYRVQLSYEF